MRRFFNTSGPCDPLRHYMLPAEQRLQDVDRLLDEMGYFVVHAPRQTGKTTTFRELARRLTEGGRYAAVHTTCETGATAGDDIEAAVGPILHRLAASSELLPVELRPPALEALADVPPEDRLAEFLQRWSIHCPRPLVVFFDEIDSLHDGSLVSVLRQLRSGFPDRPTRFPSSVALIGLRDVRDYKVADPSVVDRGRLGTSSPFNVKVESVVLRNFTADEVVRLYAQHTDETGQTFSPEALERAFEATGGQPWLVNALARLAVDATDGPIDETVIDQAAETLIQRRDTHLDSLIERLREPRVQRILEPILAGHFIPADTLHDDVQYVKDLGLVRKGPGGLEIANPIYREVIPRALGWIVEETLPVAPARFVVQGGTDDGALNVDLLLEDFRAFWCEHAEFFLERQPYAEAAAQLVFMAYLQRIVNGGGFVDREYGVGRGRIDLCVRWPRADGTVDRHAMELKVWRTGRPDPLERALVQLGEYLERLALDHGTLILFDQRADAPPLPTRCTIHDIEHDGRSLRLARL